ncbi:MAG: hypothetical protein NWE95_13595 [Candidatus Bathyarchaeota archaeon]|nr:hypothetical protein [Candidatus Bathyarchaeota archaeon]
MKRLVLRDLGEATRLIYENQRDWSRKNWCKSLDEHASETEKLLEQLSALYIWNNKLQSVPAAKELIPEVWMDIYVSITFANMGLYKHANMSLRSALETGLRLIYFSTHPTEYNWWKLGQKFGQDERNDVWGGWDYFGTLFLDFEQLCAMDDMDLFKFNRKWVTELYRNLSGSIHTHAKRLQTTTGYSPKYDSAKYIEWKDFFCQTNTYLNILLTLGFTTTFKKMQTGDKSKILDVAIGDFYNDKLRERLGL